MDACVAASVFLSRAPLLPHSSVADNALACVLADLQMELQFLRVAVQHHFEMDEFEVCHPFAPCGRIRAVALCLDKLAFSLTPKVWHTCNTFNHNKQRQEAVATGTMVEDLEQKIAELQQQQPQQQQVKV